MAYFVYLYPLLGLTFTYFTVTCALTSGYPSVHLPPLGDLFCAYENF